MTRLLALLTTLALVLAACGSTPGAGTTTGGATSAPSAAAKPTYGGTLTFGLENDVSNLEPMLSGLFVDPNIHYAMYESLVRVSPHGELLPWLSGSLEYNH